LGILFNSKCRVFVASLINESLSREPFAWNPISPSLCKRLPPRTLMLVVFQLLQTVGFYGFANWAPTFLLRQGNNLGQSLHYGFLIALVSPAGPLIAVLTADRLERKHTIVVLTLLMAATGLCFAFAVHAVAIVTIGATPVPACHLAAAAKEGIPGFSTWKGSPSFAKPRLRAASGDSTAASALTATRRWRHPRECRVVSARVRQYVRR